MDLDKRKNSMPIKYDSHLGRVYEINGGKNCVVPDLIGIS